jgi:hypothetical protein
MPGDSQSPRPHYARALRTHGIGWRNERGLEQWLEPKDSGGSCRSREKRLNGQKGQVSFLARQALTAVGLENVVSRPVVRGKVALLWNYTEGESKIYQRSAIGRTQTRIVV